MNVEQVYLQLVAAMDDVADKLTKRGNKVFIIIITLATITSPEIYPAMMI